MSQTLRKITTNFLTGEVSPLMVGRVDIDSYYNSLKQAKNVFLDPMGGCYRRPGLEFMLDLGEIGKAIVLDFQFNTEQTYTFVIYEDVLKIFKDGVLMSTEVFPYQEEDLPEVRWTQSADTIIFFHKDYPSKKVVRGANHTTWTVSSISWDVVPLYAFTLTVSNISGSVSSSAISGSVKITGTGFLSSDVGGYVSGNGGEARITKYISSSEVYATVLTEFIDTNSVSGWNIERGYEEVWSSTRGYPRCGSFHQNRLVIGGSRDLPNRMWLSKIGSYFDFDLGSVLDTDAIEAPLISDQVNEIRDVVSAGHLEVLTSGGEFFIPNEATGLTPNKVQVLRSDTRGISNVRPLYVDGTTLFIQNNANIIRELVFDDINQKYNSLDISLLSSHLFDNPVDMAHHKPSEDTQADLVYVVNTDGSVAVFNSIKMQNISGWTHCFSSRDDVEYLSVAYDDDYMYCLVKQPNNHVYLERFNNDYYLDDSVTLTSVTPTDSWGSGMVHLEGLTVWVVGDGNYLDGEHVVTSGEITTNNEYSSIEVGVSFVPTLELQVPEGELPDGTIAGRMKRIVTAIVRMHETLGITVNDMEIFFREFGQEIFDEPLEPFTGDKEVTLLGFSRNPTITIKQLEPGPFHILAVIQEVSV